MALKDSGHWVSNFWASTVSRVVGTLKGILIGVMVLITL